MDILIGTKNEYKVRELVSFLKGIDNLKIHLLKDQSFSIDVEEDGDSLKENAEKKAIEISKQTPFYTLASDGGVEIPSLGDKWDFLKTQRTVGETKTDLEKAETLLDMMKHLEVEDRRVEHYFALAIAKQGKLIWSIEKISGIGYIAEELFDEKIPRDRWMGHLWYYPDLKKVFNQLNKKELEEVRNQGEELIKILREKVQDLIEL